MHRWIDSLLRLREQEIPSVLVTVTRTDGSTPREVGARMIVTLTGISGTIGGGNLEYQSVKTARQLLETSTKPHKTKRTVMNFQLGPALGQCCGGVAQVMFEIVGDDPATNTWLTLITATASRNEPFALITVVPTVPADEVYDGKLVVSNTGIAGSLEDKFIENEAVAIVRNMLTQQSGSPPSVLTVGGQQLLVEFLFQEDFNIVLFGAGHVGKEMVEVLSGLPCRITWIDSRELEFPDSVPDNVRIKIRDATAEDHLLLEHQGCGDCGRTNSDEAQESFQTDSYVIDAPSGAYFLVMTHSHQLDFWLCESILRRGNFDYLGLIGSKTKRVKFVRRMARRGLSSESTSRLTCPIGIDGIPGKSPREIAVAVAAQILQIRAGQEESRKIDAFLAEAVTMPKPVS